MDEVPAPLPPPPPWRRRHPRLARAALYGGAAVLLGGGALWGVPAYRRKVAAEEADRQGALVTTIAGTELYRAYDPERALRVLREDVLAKSPSADTVRQARLAEAATLDFLHRYDEAERVYAALEAEWPAATPRGPLVVPWANMRVSSGRAREALEMLARPGATDGWGTAAEVEDVRARARAAPTSPGR